MTSTPDETAPRELVMNLDRLIAIDLRIGMAMTSHNGLNVCPFCHQIHDVIEECEDTTDEATR